jgi:hypothetical protein
MIQINIQRQNHISKIKSLTGIYQIYLKLIRKYRYHFCNLAISEGSWNSLVSLLASNFSFISLCWFVIY